MSDGMGGGALVPSSLEVRYDGCERGESGIGYKLWTGKMTATSDLSHTRLDSWTSIEAGGGRWHERWPGAGGAEGGIFLLD